MEMGQSGVETIHPLPRILTPDLLARHPETNTPETTLALGRSCLSSTNVSSRVLRVFVLAMIIPRASARDDDGDDFSNNLFSDLAPILALFGEQVAKQFMAGSLGWADNILFAMAPLGVITALIGAIRIAGPGWLKAIVGRARENIATAEVELTTSTSSNVCELWNGQAIVRVPGAAKLLELIYFPKPGVGPPEEQIYTVELAEHEARLEKKHKAPWGISFTSPQPTTYRRRSSPTTKRPVDEEYGSWKRNGVSSKAPQLPTPTSAPNISLNLSHNRGTTEIQAFAAFGCLLQAGVIAFSGCVVYNEYLSKMIGRDDNLPHGYPMVASGTTILVVGMLISAFVIESSTRETVWRAKLKDDRFHVMWLQQGENVNDQVFDSYAIFAEGTRDSIIKSHLVTSSHGSVANFSTRALVTGGTLLSIVGFVIQFTGFRAMHWSASVAQLAATLIMTAVRAYVRRGMTESPQSQKLPHRHELDWLATRLASEPEKLWATQFRDEKDDCFWTGDTLHWRIVTAGDATAFRFGQFGYKRSRCEITVNIREHLGKLSKWTSPVSQHAVSVASAIEVVMNVLIGNQPQTNNRVRWPMRGHVQRDELIYLSVEYDGYNWRASATEIDAVLSLWLYSSRQKDGHVQTGSCDKITAGKTDWLRNGDEVLRQQNLRLLGPVESNYIRDLTWYAGTGLAQLLEVEYVPEYAVEYPADHAIQSSKASSSGSETDSSESPAISPGESPRSSEFEDIASSRVVGFTSKNSVKLPRATSSTRYRVLPLSADSNLDVPPENTPKGHPIPAVMSRRFLALKSDVPLETLYAQDMFSTFMWAVAHHVEPLKTVVIPGELDWRSSRMDNPILSKLGKDIERVAGNLLGSFEDICFSFVPPLSILQKLSDPSCLLEYAQSLASSHEARNEWREAAEILLWLFRECSRLGPSHPVAIQAMDALYAFSVAVDKTAELWKHEQRNSHDVMEIDGVKSQLAAKFLDTVKSSPAYATLMLLTELHDWALWSQSSEVGDLTAFSGATELHRDILSLEDTKWLNALERRHELSNSPDDLGLTPLHYAVIKGGHCAVNYLIKNGIGDDFADRLGWLPLHYAVALGHAEIVQTLVTKQGGHTRAASRNLEGCTPIHYVKDANIAWVLLQERARVLVDIRRRDGATPLHCAADTNNTELARLYIEAGANVNMTDNMRSTPLHWAAHQGNREMCEYLVEKRADLTARDANGRTPMLVAVSGAHLIMQTLESDSDDLALTCDNKGLTALHFAAMLGMKGAMETILDRGINGIAQRDRYQRTPLHWAAKNGHEEAAEMLISARADVGAIDHNGWTALHLAAQMGNSAIVGMLVGEGKANVETKDNLGRKSLHLAAHGGFKPLTRGLAIEFEADLESAGIDIPSIPESNGSSHAEVARILLLEGDAIPNAKDWHGATALHYAVRYGDQLDDIARTLVVEWNASVAARDDSGKTPLHYAVGAGSVSKALMLIVDGEADVEAQDAEGWTAVHFAAAYGHLDVASMLLNEAKAKFSAKTAGRYPMWTALHLAIKFRRKEIVSFLLTETEVDINAKNEKSQTALHLAASLGFDEVVRMLLAKLKDRHVDDQDSDGSTALHLACSLGHFSTARILISQGQADFELRDNRGCTALHVVAPSENETSAGRLLKLLLTDVDAGANVEAKDHNGATALHCAVAAGRTVTAHRLLFHYEANIEARCFARRTALHYVASQTGETNMRTLLRMLVNEAKANVSAEDADGETALHVAASRGSALAIRVLVTECGADVGFKDASGATPLHLAAVGNSVAAIRVLVTECEADVEARDRRMYTPLHLAILKNSLAAARALVSGANADVEAMTIYGDRPLHIAARDSTNAADALSALHMLATEREANVTAKNKLGETPLHGAARHGYTDRGRFLIKIAKADVNTKNNHGWTALHLAAWNGHTLFMHMLVTEGLADVHVKEENGWTALHCAARNGHQDCVRFLVREGRAEIGARDSTGTTPMELAKQRGDITIIRFLRNPLVLPSIPEGEDTTKATRRKAVMMNETQEGQDHPMGTTESELQSEMYI